jgi:hypothetical protein
MNPAEPGQTAQPVKVGANLTGELTVALFAGELKAMFVQPTGVDVGIGVLVDVGVGIGEPLIVGITLGVGVGTGVPAANFHALA